MGFNIESLCIYFEENFLDKYIWLYFLVLFE